MTSRTTSNKFRVIHRYLGFFLAGIMAVYAISGMILIFRNTDFLKTKVKIEKQVAPNLAANKLGPALKIKRLRVQKEEGNLLYFKNGTYDRTTGMAKYTKSELPYLLDKMTHLHKANTNHPLFFLNIFFGASLLFFVISAFWMFMPGTDIFKKGVWFSLAGIILTLVLLFVG